MRNLFVVWNDIQATGIPLIDEYHKGVIYTMNSLHYFLGAKNSRDIAMPLVAILEQYVNLHFKAEESLLREAQYKDADQHALHHITIKRILHLLLSRLKRHGKTDELLMFLMAWWKEHIEIYDNAYAKHVNEYLRNKMNESV